MHFLKQIHALALAIAILSACPSMADEPAVIITGTVKVGGKPLPDGAIIFYLDDEFVGSKVKDGKYRITRAPAGRWRVGVIGKDVPQKYGSKEATPLTAEARRGHNVFTFELAK